MSVPIQFAEVANLCAPPVGASADHIKFGTCTLQSDKYVTICENKESICIVDIAAGYQTSRQSITAEAAIMNPLSKVLALRSGQQMQIYNMDLRTKMKEHNMPEQVSFWVWVTPAIIGIVTPSAVYHWSIEGSSPPAKVFDKNPALVDGVQVINYSISTDAKWCLLSGISGGGQAINGTMQLYSVDRASSQILQGHAGAFCELKVDMPGRDGAQAKVFCYEDTSSGSPQLKVLEVGRDKNAPGGVFKPPPSDIPVAPDAAGDFPLFMTAVSSTGMLYMTTKAGYVYVYDLFTNVAVYRARMTQDNICAVTLNTTSNGILVITRRGQMLHVALNDAAVVPYVINTLGKSDLALTLASRLNLPGADDIYKTQFDAKMASGDVEGAARIAAASPRGFLRNAETIMKFKQLQGTPPPLFKYFLTLLEKGDLNAQETLELADPVIKNGKIQVLEKYMAENKLTLTEELGDLLMPINVDMALSIYLKANASDKVINCFMQKGEFDKIVTYAQQANYRVDYSFMLQQLVRTNPTGAVAFAKKLCTNESGQQLIDANTVTDVFLGMNLLREATEFLLDALKSNRKEEGFLQTRLLEINLRGGMPQVADAILGNEMFTHYDRVAVAKLCEQCGLMQRALENYTDIADIKRVMQNGVGLTPEFLLTYFGSVSKEGSLEILREMLARNIRANLANVVQIAIKYSDPLGPESLISLFEDFKSFEGLFHYLNAIVNFSQVPSVHLKYIQAAAQMQQWKEVERVCRDSTVYDPLEVKKFLMETKLADPRPLIHVCDRFDFVDEMTAYLYNNNQTKYIEVYVQKVSPQKTPQVVGKLLDLECKEDMIKDLLNSVGQMCPIPELVEQVEHRNRLRLLHSWLEARVAQGNTEAATHNAIGKIYITLNKDPMQFLSNNQYYEPKVLGIFCEKLDPTLAFAAYKMAKGECDDDLIRVCQENGLFKDLAYYLVGRQDIELWTRVLNPEGYTEGDPEPPSRRYLLDQVVQTALPDTDNPDEVSSTVKAFIDCDLPGELIELLERIVLQGQKFHENPNLQNLLILTAMRADKDKVMEFVNRLDKYNGPEIAKVAASEENKLYEEALAIYVKFGSKTDAGEEQNNLHVAAIEVIVDLIQDLDRAKEFSERVNVAPVWSKLGKAFLDAQNVSESVAAYIKAGDADDYHLVINAAEAADDHENLVTYLKMCRKTIKEQLLDTQLIYSLAKINKLAELEEVISVANVAKIDTTGERCFDEGMYQAAKILFSNINNNAKLALCYVKLEQFREAVDAAGKANSITTWKEVCLSCLKAEEYRLASQCGLHIIVHPDHLEELISHYERAGKSTELVALMEQGLGQDNAHAGVFTELGVLYTKYMPEKLMEHIKIFHTRMNINKILRACEKALMWPETVYLYKEDNQHDSAVKIMVDHATAFQHDLFLDCVQKVRNPEVQYKAISHYLGTQPMQLGRLLQVLTPNLDHARAVHLLRKSDGLNLAVEYMKSVQKENLSVVNEALNEIFVAEEDHEALKTSIDEFDNFDQIFLAQKCEKHELLEFRRVAAYIYKNNKRYPQSLALSKADKMFKDAIDTVADSNLTELAEDLLRFFVDEDDKACFTATLYSCYDLISPDLAIELAWRKGYTDFAMPYLIQYLKHLHDKVGTIDKRTAPPEEDKSAEEATSAAANPLIMGGLIMGNETLMIQNGSPGYGPYGQQPGGIPDPYAQQQPQYGYGMPQGGMPGGYPPQPGYGNPF
jgi:clathrin heavy chain